MKSSRSLRKVERGLRAPVAPGPEPPQSPRSPHSPHSPHSPTTESESSQLARQVVAAFADQLDRYRRAAAQGEYILDPRTTPPDSEVQSIRDKPRQQCTFGDLDRLSKIDPALAMARWEEVRAAAAQEVDGGFLAARALEYLDGSAWDLACFGAVRRRLREAWPPRNAGEAMLIDEMAQYEMMRQTWVRILSMMAHEPDTILRMRRRGERSNGERTQDAAQATLEAARMVERLQRLYQNALRTLLSLRRGRAPFIVQRSGQVNVAMGPQLNVGPVTAERPPNPAEDASPPE